MNGYYMEIKATSRELSVPSQQALDNRRWYKHPVAIAIAGIALCILLAPLKTYTHELGHYSAMKLLFTNASPTIVLTDYGYGGGYCALGGLGLDHPLSKIGELLGKSLTKTIIYAAGPLTDILVSLSVRHLTRDTITRTVTMLYDLNLTSYLLMNVIEMINQQPCNGDFGHVRSYGGDGAFALLGLLTVVNFSVAVYQLFQSPKRSTL
jgi:hypothetical protein